MVNKTAKKLPLTSELEEWLWLIAGREEKLEMAKKENKEIKKAMDIIDEMSMDEKEWELYQSRKMAIMDYNTGIREAKEEGERKSKKEIAQKLLKKNMTIEEIEEITGLNKEEIEKL